MQDVLTLLQNILTDVNNNFVEGKQIEIDLAPEYNIRLTEIEKALKSSISYAGCKDLSCLSDTKFIQLK